MLAKSRQLRRKIRVSEIRALSELQVSEREAAATLRITLKTFQEMIRVDSRAREAWERGRELGRVSIRRSQFELAKRHPQMAIFLGKQYLGQSEISVIEHSGRDGGPIKTLDLTKLDASGRKALRDVLTTTRVKK